MALINGICLPGIRKSFSGVLDDLGLTDYLVFSYSPTKRLTSSFTDELVQIKKMADSYNYEWFGYDSLGNLEVNEVQSFLGSEDGGVRTSNNQANISYPAYQYTNGNTPLLFSSGVLNNLGAAMDGSGDHFKVDNYSAIDFDSPELSVYIDFYIEESENTNYIFSKGESPTWQYRLFRIIYGEGLAYRSTLSTTYLSLPDYQAGHNKIVMTWANDNTTNIKSSYSSKEGSRSASLPTGYPICIGGRFDDPGFTTTAYTLCGKIKYLLIFNKDIYSYYNALSYLLD